MPSQVVDSLIGLVVYVIFVASFVWRKIRVNICFWLQKVVGT